MALKIWDGFDHYNQTNDFLARSGFLQWQLPGTFQPTISFVTGRNSRLSALRFTNVVGVSTYNIPCRAVWGARNAEAWFGHAILIPGGTVGPACSFYITLMDNVAGTVQDQICFNGNNYSVQIFRGDLTGTSLLLTANNVWTPDVWNFIEVHAKIDGSTGAIEVKSNGVTIASVTGANTKNTANAWFDATDYACNSVGGGIGTFVEMDDLYYLDTTTGAGTWPANTWLGDSRTATLFPNGEGTVQWTPLSGTNWSQVSETAMDSDTSYNYTSTAANEDQINFQALSASIPVIFGLQITIAARKDDAGSRVIKTGVKSGATTSYGSNHSLPDTSYAWFTDQWILDPNTSADWTVTAVNSVVGLYNLVS